MGGTNCGRVRCCRSGNNLRRVIMPNTKRKQTHLKSVPPTTTAEETKRERFIRIGNARMQRALNSIRLLGNLANTNYEWGEDDIRAMQNTVLDQLNRPNLRPGDLGLTPQHPPLIKELCALPLPSDRRAV